jgi:hypothetical protein
MATAMPAGVREAQAAGCTVWPARRLGTQLHLGPHEPVPARCQPIAQTPPRGYDRLGYVGYNQPTGGLYTASLLPGPTSAYHAHVTRGILTFAASARWWTLEPPAGAWLLVLAGPAAYRAALARFRHGRTAELDFVAIRDAGFAGVHLPQGAVAGLRRPLHHWAHEQTLWLAWAFPAPAVEIPPPARPEPAPEPPPAPWEPGGVQLAWPYQYHRLPPPYAQFWFITGRPLSAAEQATLQQEDRRLQRLRRRTSLASQNAYVEGHLRLFVDYHIADHNLPLLRPLDLSLRLTPAGPALSLRTVGPGLFDALLRPSPILPARPELIASVMDAYKLGQRWAYSERSQADAEYRPA